MTFFRQSFRRPSPDHDEYEPNQSLRTTVLNLSEASDGLRRMPERLAEVLRAFDNRQLDPNFRRNIYEVLNGSVEIAQALASPTFPIDPVITRISQQLYILSTILNYLNTTPENTGYALFSPSKGKLTGHYTTELEAKQVLAGYRAMGMSSDCEVVPTRIKALYQSQPYASPLLERVQFGPSGEADVQVVPTKAEPLPPTTLQDTMARVDKAEDEIARLEKDIKEAQ